MRPATTRRKGSPYSITERRVPELIPVGVGVHRVINKLDCRLVVAKSSKSRVWDKVAGEVALFFERSLREYHETEKQNAFTNNEYAIPAEFSCLATFYRPRAV